LTLKYDRYLHTIIVGVAVIASFILLASMFLEPSREFFAIGITGIDTDGDQVVIRIRVHNWGSKTQLLQVRMKLWNSSLEAFSGPLDTVSTMNRTFVLLGNSSIDLVFRLDKTVLPGYRYVVFELWRYNGGKWIYTGVHVYIGIDRIV